MGMLLLGSLLSGSPIFVNSGIRLTCGATHGGASDPEIGYLSAQEGALF